MEKLIDLINERETERFGDQREKIGYDTGLDSSHLISKKDGFIGRLIKKDKIDTFRLLEKWFDTQKGYEWVHYHTVSEGNTDLLLMLLSIQEEPISFLIDLLK